MELFLGAVVAVIVAWVVYHFFFADKKSVDTTVAPYKVEPPVVKSSVTPEVVQKAPELKVETGGKPSNSRRSRGQRPRTAKPAKQVVAPVVDKKTVSVKPAAPIKRKPKPPVV